MNFIKTQTLACGSVYAYTILRFFFFFKQTNKVVNKFIVYKQVYFVLKSFFIRIMMNTLST